MATLTTYFYGICAHVKEPDITGVPHRCVLPNGIVPSIINGQSIGTHVAVVQFLATDLLSTNLTFPPPDSNGTITWQISGADLTIANEISVPPNGINYAPSYGSCVPSLTTLTPDGPPLSAAVVNGRDPLSASCYFDVSFGNFVGGVDPNGAAIAVLTSEVNGAAIINASSFVWGNGFFILADGAEIVISNLGAGAEFDSLFDFFLQYRILESIPPNAGLPEFGSGDCPTISIPLGRVKASPDVGPGCSNSTYP